ncbi:MAG: NAD(P)H-hydrate dehydratase [Candidatus Hydrogenedentota bacterium]
MDTLSLDMMKGLLPPRPDTGHKGTFGHVFIIGGSQGYMGAPVLAGMGAARSGVGLVTVGMPESLSDLPSMGLWEAMTFALPETKQHTISMAAIESTSEFAASKDATVVGPGMSLHGKTRQYILQFIEQCRAPLLIDADGLNALSAGTDCILKRTHDTVLTPHPGEMARILHTSTEDVIERREECAKNIAKELAVTVVLKGYQTIVAAPDGSCVENSTGNNGMGTAGSGDVLSGLIGGLMAQGLSGHDAAQLGVFVHGLAGDIAADYYSQRGMIARDIVQCLPEAWHELESEQD